MIKTVSDQEFAQVIETGIVMIDFWAAWCGPCNTLAPVIEEVAKEMEGLTIGKVNVDDYPELAGKYGVMSIPSLLFFKDGNLMDSSIGVVSKSIILKKLERLSE